MTWIFSTKDVRWPSIERSDGAVHGEDAMQGKVEESPLIAYMVYWQKPKPKEEYKFTYDSRMTAEPIIHS